jgi:hypothetical protein
MDPLTAIGLAGNILAFIDFGTKLAKAAYEVYESKDGATAVRKFFLLSQPPKLLWWYCAVT